MNAWARKALGQESIDHTGVLGDTAASAVLCYLPEYLTALRR